MLVISYSIIVPWPLETYPAQGKRCTTSVPKQAKTDHSCYRKAMGHRHVCQRILGYNLLDTCVMEICCLLKTDNGGKSKKKGGGEGGRQKSQKFTC